MFEERFTVYELTKKEYLRGDCVYYVKLHSRTYDYMMYVETNKRTYDILDKMRLSQVLGLEAGKYLTKEKDLISGYKYYFDISEDESITNE